MAAPLMILIRPQMGENIGAAARAMLNFNLEELRVVAPRDGWPNPRAVAMASGAGRLLEQAGPYPDVTAAVADCHYVLATTARTREMTRPVLTPAAAMAAAHARIAAGQKVGVLFGPERAGLENADIALASAIVSVPVNPAFSSLNLAQCVLLLAYEWQRQTGSALTAPLPEPATILERQQLADHYEADLEAAGFFFPPTKAVSMKQGLRAMWGRLDLTPVDVRILHGVLRQLRRQGKEAGGGSPPPHPLPPGADGPPVTTKPA